MAYMAFFAAAFVFTFLPILDNSEYAKALLRQALELQMKLYIATVFILMLVPLVLIAIMAYIPMPIAQALADKYIYEEYGIPWWGRYNH